jgi:hypothetical protein
LVKKTKKRKNVKPTTTPEASWDQAETIQQVMDELAEAGVIRKTGEQREGCDVYKAVPGKTFEDYEAWLRRRTLN